MRTVYVRVDDLGAWALTRCRHCHEVHKYRLSDAVGLAVCCKSCLRPLDMRSALRAEAGPQLAQLRVAETRARPQRPTGEAGEEEGTGT